MLQSIVIGGEVPPNALVAVTVLDALPESVADQVQMQHGEDLNLAQVVSCAKGLLALLADRTVLRRALAANDECSLPAAAAADESKALNAILK